MNVWQKAIAFALLTLASSALAMSVKEALGQIETGADQPGQCAADFVRGAAGEVSRYQLLPAVWRAYGGGDPTDPTNAWAVTCRAIQDRSGVFERVVHRPPTARELYGLWTAPGQFAKGDYDWQRLSPAVRERSQRFANLVAVKDQNDFAAERSVLIPAATTGSARKSGNAVNLSVPNGDAVVESK